MMPAHLRIRAQQALRLAAELLEHPDPQAQRSAAELAHNAAGLIGTAPAL